MTTIDLAGLWQARQLHDGETPAAALADAHGWLPAAVPGAIHLALIDAGRLPDPFEGMSEAAAQWVGEADWIYQTTFALDAAALAAPNLDLVCDGLDTFATLYLNGAPIATSENMFVPLRIAIGAHASAGNNTLAIVFASALLRGREFEAEHGALACWNGEPSRLYVRKAQYHYGWDWGPVLLTAGPWRGVRVEAYAGRIAALQAVAALSDDMASATIAVTIQAAGHAERARVSVALVGGGQVGSAEAAIADGTAQLSFLLEAPELWYPNGYGAQPLYRVEAALDGGEIQTQTIGLRRVELVQGTVAGEDGTSFFFRVNGVAVFCGGANWIPADSFTTRVTPERYRAWVDAAADMHMTMLRVWGGGIYEDAAFYEACDARGILVWQDFMFGCGVYPAHAAFVASVRAEAEAQLRRLRHHPCIAIWCGNNEDYQIADSLGLYRHEATPEANAQFPARQIYEVALPAVCAAEDPTRPYWAGSPYGGPSGNSAEVGDRHVWDIWHGATAPYQNYPDYAGRFVSEFGMEALPDLATVESFAPPEERYAQSRTMDFHNKAAGGPRRLAAYIFENVRVPGDLEGYIYASQFVQAEAMLYAYRGWRRRWRGAGAYATGGALVWQLDDCWPVTSWAIMDYYLRPKAACAAIRRALAPLAVGLARSGDGAEVWVVNGTLESVEVTVELRLWELDGTPMGSERLRATIGPNGATELGASGFSLMGAVILEARLLVEDAVVSRDSIWPEPFRYAALPDPLLILGVDGEAVQVSAIRPAKGVLLAAGDGVAWSDNFLDLFPGDERTLTARGLGDAAVSATWLGR